jgi:hypothetical protein
MDSYSLHGTVTLQGCHDKRLRLNGLKETPKAFKLQL